MLQKLIYHQIRMMKEYVNKHGINIITPGLSPLQIHRKNIWMLSKLPKIFLKFQNSHLEKFQVVWDRDSVHFYKENINIKI